jgi:AraC-like DNA-binding protein
MLPGSGSQLIIALHEQPITWADGESGSAWHSWKRGILHGPQSSYYRAGPKPVGTVMGAVFRPGAVGAITGMPAGELLDRHVQLDELWGASAWTLQERLASCPDANSALQVLEQELLARLKTPLLIHPAVAHTLRANYRQSIENICSQTGYSHRHFVAEFRSAVGLTPKHFFRIRRFSVALHMLASQETNLADVAAHIGYADQAHFTREFREFCGVPPSAYHPRSKDNLYHHVVR